MNWDRLTTLRRAGRVSRVHTLPLLHRQTVGEHTYGVLCIIDNIVNNDDDSKLLNLPVLWQAALHHDACEADLGDIPAVVKWRYPKIEDAMKEAESDVTRNFGLVKLMPQAIEARVLKFADLMELVYFGLEEMFMGNTLVETMVFNALEAVEKRGLVEVTSSSKEFYASLTAKFYEWRKT